MVRVKCSACGSTKDISYLGVDGGSEAIKAECCEACRTYVKIFYLEKDTRLVPAADDGHADKAANSGSTWLWLRPRSSTQCGKR
jgi:formate dehydrogenase accessory protein FdhE